MASSDGFEALELLRSTHARARLPPQLTKVWTPKGESTAPLMLDLDELAQQAVDQSNQAAAAKKAAAVGADKESEAEEVDDLKRLFGKD